MIKINKNNPVVIFGVVFILLFLLYVTGFLAPLGDFLLSTTKPLNANLYRWSSSSNNSYHSSRGSKVLQNRISELNKKVLALTVANSRCLEIGAENTKLRASLNFLKINNFKAVTASIIAKQAPIDNNGDLIIDRGSRDGLRPGLGVISQGVIIGKIIEVKDTSATFCLTTSANCKLAATIQNQTKTRGIVNGNLGLTIEMNYIPQSENIKTGDMVITSGLGGNIPRGLLIGKISRIYNTSNEVWQTATIEPLLNPGSLTVVLVIIT